MSLLSLKEILDPAKDENFAVPAFNFSLLRMLKQLFELPKN